MSKQLSKEDVRTLKELSMLLKGDSFNSLGVILSQKGNLKALTDLNTNQIIGLIGAYSYLTFIPNEKEREECSRLLDYYMQLFISKKRQGRKELIKLGRTMRQFLSLFQRKSTQESKEIVD